MSLFGDFFLLLFLTLVSEFKLGVIGFGHPKTEGTLCTDSFGYFGSSPVDKKDLPTFGIELVQNSYNSNKSVVYFVGLFPVLFVLFFLCALFLILKSGPGSRASWRTVARDHSEAGSVETGQS